MTLEYKRLFTFFEKNNNSKLEILKKQIEISDKS